MHRIRSRPRSHSAALLLAFLLAACSDSSGPPPQPPVTPLDLSQAGGMRVSVRYRGPVPDPAQINMSSAGACAAMHPEPVYDRSLRVADGGVADALVYIKSGFGDRAFTFPTQPVVIDQRGCLYQPRVAAVMVGQPLQFLNSDPEAHNVRGRPAKVSAWNFMMSRPQATRTLYFDAPEIGIRIGCDIHPWMSADVSVLANPYFGVTPENGAVVLKDVPPGDYVIGVWHEVLGEREQAVSVPARGEAAVEIVFPPKS